MDNWNRGSRGFDQREEEEEDDQENNNPPPTLYESIEEQLNNLRLFNHHQQNQQQQQNYLNHHHHHNNRQNLQDAYSDFPYGVVSHRPPRVLPPLPHTLFPGSSLHQAHYVNEMLSMNRLGSPSNYTSNNRTASVSSLGTNGYGGLDTQGLRGGFVNNDFGLYRGNSFYPEEIISTSRSRMRQFSNQVNVNGFVGRNHHPRDEDDDKIKMNAGYFELIKRDSKLHRLLIDMAKDRFGRDFLQGRLENGSYDDIQFLIGVFTSHIKKLMVDPFGHVLILKMFLKCTEGQIGEIVNILTNNGGYELIHICLDSHGTKSVQKLLESLTSGQHITKVMSVLSKATVELTKDTSGHHVIQQCLKTFSNEENKHLFHALAKNCVDIARDQNGCCVLQSFVLKTDEHLRAQFVGEITHNALVLAQDPYGNYVVQYVVGQKIKEATRSLAKNLKGHFENLSTNKFSSHLVEKFLKESDDEFVIKFIIDELVNKSNFLMLLQDQYANFVIQSALDVAEEVSMFDLIVSVIEKNYQSLRNHPYGKRVVLHMNQLLREKQRNHHHYQFQHHI